MPSVDAQQLERRRKLFEAMGNQAIAGSPTQMVSGRAVPQGIGQGLTRLAQAYMAGQGMKGVGEEERDIEGKRSAASQGVIEAMMGRPEQALPQGMAGPPTPPVEADPTKAALMAATDPYLQDNKGLQGVTQAMLKAKGVGSGADPYYKFLPTAEGYAIGDTRSGKITPAEGIIRSQDDPALQETLSGVKEKGELTSQLELKPKVESAVLTAKADAQKKLDKPKEKMRTSLVTNNLDVLSDAVTELRDHKGLPGITGAVYGRIPSVADDSIDAQAKLETITSKIFVSALQSMREASKTGGAVGNVSNAEGTKLENSMAALSRVQTTEAFKDELNKILVQLEESKRLIDEAHEATYNQDQPAISLSAEKPTAGFDAEKERRYQAWKAQQ